MSRRGSPISSRGQAGLLIRFDALAVRGEPAGDDLQVGLTFAIAIDGDIRPRGAEALDFGWYPATGLRADEVGFGEIAVIIAVVARLRA